MRILPLNLKSQIYDLKATDLNQQIPFTTFQSNRLKQDHSIQTFVLLFLTNHRYIIQKNCLSCRSVRPDLKPHLILTETSCNVKLNVK